MQVVGTGIKYDAHGVFVGIRLCTIAVTGLCLARKYFSATLARSVG